VVLHAEQKKSFGGGGNGTIEKKEGREGPLHKDIGGFGGSGKRRGEKSGPSLGGGIVLSPA